MRLTEFDLDTAMLTAPSPNESLHFAEPMQEETVGDQNQVVVGPIFSRDPNMFNDLRIQQRLTSEKSESPRFQTMRPIPVFGLSVFDGRWFAGDVEVGVMTPSLARQIAAMRDVVFKCR